MHNSSFIIEPSLYKFLPCSLEFYWYKQESSSETAPFLSIKKSDRDRFIHSFAAQNLGINFKVRLFCFLSVAWQDGSVP